MNSNVTSADKDILINACGKSDMVEQADRMCEDVSNAEHSASSGTEKAATDFEQTNECLEFPPYEASHEVAWLAKLDAFFALKGIADDVIKYHMVIEHMGPTDLYSLYFNRPGAKEILMGKSVQSYKALKSSVLL